MKPPATPPTAAMPPAPRPDPPLAKKILFSLVIVALLFGLLEVLLLAAGVRPVLVDEDPFVGFAGNVPLFVAGLDSTGHEVMTTAANKRLFNPQSFPRVKADGTFRIFCLGGSTTYGRPYDDNSSFAGWLRELLPQVAPAVNWEVVNAGGVSYASYRVTRVMQELVRYEPDLFIVYTGQNEFLEERTYRNLRATPASVRALSGLLARTRTWTLVGWSLRRLGVTAPGTGGDRAELAEEADTLLEHFGPEVYRRDDYLRARIVDHYRISLERMAQVAAGASAGLVLVKPASNLKDCSPFKSQHTDGLTAAATARSQQWGAAARMAMAEGQWASALTALDQALELDPRYAEHHYRRGKVLLELDREDEAQASFLAALDEDVCTLRALPSMLRLVARIAADHGLPLVDFEAIVADLARRETGRAIAGQELFLDHVHPTIQANGRLAYHLAEVVLAAAGQPATGLTEDALVQAGQAVAARLGPAQRARSLANLAAVLAWAGKLEDAARPAHRALELEQDDPLTTATAAGILATWYATSGDGEQERRYYRLALNANPHNHDTHWRLGLRALDRDPPETELAAAHVLYAAVYWQGAHREAPHRVLGGLLATRGQTRAGFAHLLEARRLNPDDPETAALFQKVAGRLGAAARSLAPPRFSVERYPSGAIRRIIQVKVGPDGQAVADGIWSEWHEGGEPARYREIADGAPSGADVAWDAEGRVVSGGAPTGG